MNKALFLDRDGVLNVDKGYVYKWDDIIWIEEIFEIIKIANDRGYKVIVLTNQSGIHKGMYSEQDVHLLHKKMNDFLSGKALIIDEWYYCAEMDSEFRKPRPGMLLEAQKKFNIDFSKSFMVGDKSTDIFETDGLFTRPFTLLVKGSYELNHSDIGKNVSVFDSHADILAELKKLL
jgi:D,D-heptose 1,7-bisphosphate phosphatase